MDIEFPLAEPRPVVLVAGLSGAGQTTALNTLEDLGYKRYALPLHLVETALDHPKTSRGPLAIAIDHDVAEVDAREQLNTINTLRNRKDLNLSVVFLDCDNHVLQQRFVSTRRRHRLEGRDIENIFDHDRQQLEGLRRSANSEFNTTDMKPKQLARLLRMQYGLDWDLGPRIMVTSFAHGKGIPPYAGTVIDARILDNPHYEEQLKSLTGEDPRVRDFLKKDPDFAEFIELQLKAVEMSLTRLTHDEGVQVYTIAVGCTGGQHRSVAIAVEIAEHLGQLGYNNIELFHRELNSGARWTSERSLKQG
jgi:UPF0042 nucleotide-binding protein